MHGMSYFWLAMAAVLPCGCAIYKEGDMLTAMDYNRAYPVLDSNMKAVPKGSMFRFRDFHGSIIAIDKSDCRCRPCWKYAPPFENAAKQFVNDSRVIFVTAFYWYEGGCLQAWLKRNPHGSNHIYINTEKPGLSYMSYVSDWWSIARPHFHVLDGNTTLVHMWHYYQMGSDGGMLANAVRALMPTTQHTVPLPPAPLFDLVSLDEKICAPEGSACTCLGGLVKFGAGSDWTPYRATDATTGRVACTNGVFGDPDPGATKICMCKGGKTPTLSQVPATLSRAPTVTRAPSPTRQPTSGAPTKKKYISSGHPYANKCESTMLINAACPKGAPGNPIPSICDAKCAKVFCGWYGECMMTPFVKQINNQLPGQLQNFFLKCITVIKNGH